MNDIFDNLTRVKQARTTRCSSWDVTGRNMDAWIIPKRGTRVLADIKGPGKITHIWMTQGNDDTEFLRKILLRFYWDGEENPSILVPLEISSAWAMVWLTPFRACFSLHPPVSSPGINSVTLLH